jgi:hypothetical protein
MKARLIRRTEEIIGESESTEWLINRDDGAITISIDKIMSDEVIECFWLDNDHEMIQVFYSSWNGSELWAIINIFGNIIRDGIRSIEEVIEHQKAIVVEMSGFGMGDDAREFDLDYDDWKMAVINQHGSFIIPPKYNKIWFDDSTNLFFAKNYGASETAYNVRGMKVEF